MVISLRFHQPTFNFTQKQQGHPTDRFGEYLFARPIIAYDFRIFPAHFKKCAGKTGVFFSSNFRDMGNAMPVVFEETKMSF